MNMPLSRFMPRVKVYLLSSEIAINGHRKSFQAPTNAKMPTTVIVPLTCGTQMWKNRCHRLAPSTMAASSSSIGMDLKALVMSRMLMAPHRPGSATASSVFCRWMERMIRNWEIITPSIGMTMVPMNMVNTSPRPRHFRRPSA